MSRTVHKYVLNPAQPNPQEIQMPKGALRFLHVDVQRGHPCLWAEVEGDTDAYESLWVWIFGTGHIFPDKMPLNYLGSFLLYEGDFVGHVYVEEPEAGGPFADPGDAWKMVPPR